MKKILKTMRGLLVAAALCVGVNGAWADGSSVGSTENTDDFWTVFSDHYTIQTNQTLTLNFTNHAGAANYNSWVIALSTDADRGASGYSEYVVLRNDNYAWQSGTYSKTVDNVEYIYNKTTAEEAEPVITDGVTTTNGNTHNWYTSLNSYFEWTNFPTLMNGSTVTLTVKREWAKVTVRADITGSDGNAYWEEFVMNCGLGGLPIRAFLSVDHSHITDLTSSIATTTGIEESTAIYERGTSIRPWIETDVNEWSKSANSVTRSLNNAETGIKIETYAGSLTKSISYTDGNILSYDIVWNVGASYGSNNTSYLKIGDNITFTTSSQEQKGTLTIGETDYTIPNACNKNNGNRDGDQWTIHADINTRTKEIKTLTISGNKGTNKVNYTIPSVLSLNEDANLNSIKIGITRPSSASSLWTAIKSIVVSERSTASVTTEFVDEKGNKLKTDVVEEINIGTDFTPAFDAVINTEFKKYTYVSGGDAATVTDDVTRTILYNSAWQDAFSSYTIKYAQDYDISSSVVDWTTATGGRYTPVIREENGNRYLSVEQTQRQNNGTTLTCNSITGKVAAGSNFSMTFDIKLGSSNNQTNTEFSISNAENSATMFSLKETGTYATTWKINGNSLVELPGSGSEGNSTTSDNIDNLTWYTIKLVVIDGNEHISIFNKSTGALLKDSIVTLTSNTGGLGKMTFATSRYMANFAMDNILVRDVAVGDIKEVTPTITTADGLSYFASTQTITLACETEGASIYYTTDGTEPTSSSTLYEEPFIIDATTTVKAIAIKGYALSDVVSVTYSKLYELADVTEATTWNWSAVTSSNAYSDLTDATTPTKSEAFILANTEFYMDGGYTIPEGFGNAQQLEVIAQFPFRYASNKGMFQGNSIKFHTTVPGKVKVNFSNTGGGDRPQRYVKVNEMMSVSGSADGTPMDSEEFPVAAGDVTITGYIPDTGAAMLRIYSVIFTPVTQVSPSVTDYATFSAAYPLDFSAATGVKAYYASGSDASKVTMTKVTGTVAGGTGLLLQKTDGDINIPVAVSGEDLSATNLMKAGTGAAVRTEGNTHRYVLAGEGDATAFFELSASKDAVKIPVGKAYLEVTMENASRLFISFSVGETSGISQIENGRVSTEDAVYNLQGQRIANPTKGLYIVNGKKIIKH